MGVPVDICEPWVEPDRLCCPDVEQTSCIDGEPIPSTYVWTDEELIEIASNILFRQTCNLFPGHCQITVRPCAYCGCNRRHCGCGRYIYVDLQDRYPVISVDEVKVDGLVVPPTSYRVDDFHRLVRTDNECWPSCNDFTEPTTAVDTFEVTYTAGRRPPPELQMAAAELACELKRACGGNDCRLPANVTSVQRQGVTLNIDALEAAVTTGQTGLAAVDLAVRHYDCNRAKARVAHPYLRGPRGVYES